MTTQPTALYLADVIDNDAKSAVHHKSAAAELRRLHEENRVLQDSCEAKADRIDRLGESVERLQALQPDAERYRWLSAHCYEVWVRPETLHSEFPDTRLRWEFPHLQSCNCIGSTFTLREAIDIEIKRTADAAIDAARGET